MKHIMIDIETLDTRETASVLQIGAVMFDAHGIASEFSVAITPESNEHAGRTISASTIRWWLQQDDAASQEPNPVIEL